MPIYNFKCPECGEDFRKVLPHLTEHKKPCPKCGKAAEYTGKGPTSRIVEVRDNGFMPKKVEQLADIDEIVKERSTTKPEDDII